MSPQPLAWATLAVVWTAYLPLGARYVVAFAAALLAARSLRPERRESLGSLERPAWQRPGLLPMVLLPVWLAVSAAWSPAPWSEIGGHLWLYALPLLVPLLAPVLPPVAARRALAHFVGISAFVASLFVVQRWGGVWPDSLVWSSTVAATGNQRIANSLLLALAAGIALWLARRARTTGTRAGWAACTALILLGLALQDRRSGMLVLPPVLLAWLWLEVRTPGRRALAVALVLAGTGAALLAVEPVRGRFDEGLRELLAAEPAEQVATSWGQRLHMLRLTAAMAAERPIAGHGIASWQQLWRQRTPAGSALAEHSTPHNEYLLVAQQGGAIGLVLLAWLLLAMARTAARAGTAGAPALMVWVVIACAGLFNAVLRDAKFSLVLLLLAALAAAAAADAEPPAQRQG